MTSFEDIKKMARETAEVIADRSAVFARATADKAKIMAKITMLTADMTGDKETLRKAYQELGKQYYALADKHPIEDLEPLLASLKAANERLDAKKAEVDSLKVDLKTNSDGSINADYVDVPDEDTAAVSEEKASEPEVTVNVETVETVETVEPTEPTEPTETAEPAETTANTESAEGTEEPENKE